MQHNLSILDGAFIALAKAIRLKDFAAAEIELDIMVRGDHSYARSESVAKGRADAEVILRRRLAESGVEYVAAEAGAAG